MTDNELEAMIIAVLKTMREATRKMDLTKMPELNNKLQQVITAYMTN